MTKRAEIERLLRAGEVPVEEIAKRVGTTPTYVRQKRWGLGIKPPPRKLSASPKAEYVRQYTSMITALLTAEERSAIRCREYRKARDRGLSVAAAKSAATIAMHEACRRRYHHLRVAATLAKEDAS